MGEDTNIEWCDHTFNPWEGCAKVSPGCANCYAEARNARFGGGTAPNWGKGAPRRRTSKDNWKLPLKWNRDAEYVLFHWNEGNLGDLPEPHRPRVFCASLADWLDDEVPAAWLADLLVLIHSTPNLDWLLLTKRPENWESRMMAALEWIDESEPAFTWLAQWVNGLPLRPVPSGPIAPGNVWIGTTVEDQARADQRIPELLKIPAKVRFLSCEPLLGALDLANMVREDGGGEHHYSALECDVDPADDGEWGGRTVNWVICGGESGPKARPMHPDWARFLRDQCAAASVPFLFKQWGEWLPELDADRDDPDGRADYAGMKRKGGVVLNLTGGCGFHGERVHMMAKVGKKAAGRVLDGVEHNGFPDPARC